MHARHIVHVSADRNTRSSAGRLRDVLQGGCFVTESLCIETGVQMAVKLRFRRCLVLSPSVDREVSSASEHQVDLPHGRATIRHRLGRKRPLPLSPETRRAQHTKKCHAAFSTSSGFTVRCDSNCSRQS